MRDRRDKEARSLYRAGRSISRGPKLMKNLIRICLASLWMLTLSARADWYQATITVTNIASALAAAINSDQNTNPITKGVAITNPVFYGLFTLTNPATGNKVTATNGDVTAHSYIASGTGTNLIGLSTFTNVHNGHFLF